MHKSRLLRAPLLALFGLLAVLIVPAAAQAHHVNSEAECVLVGDVPTLRLTAEFVSFTSTHDVTGSVVVDDVPRFSGPVPITWVGDNGTWVYTSPAVAGQKYHVVTSWHWGNSSDGEDHTTLACPTPPPTITPPPTTPPAGGGVLPETIVSGIARLRGPSGCVKTAFRARVTGRSIASVAFRVDGKLVKRITGERSRYTVRVKPRGYGFGRHRVVARVTFVTGSGTAPRRLPLTFRRCAQGAVAPRFTG
jgi:hypothetical protein